MTFQTTYNEAAAPRPAWWQAIHPGAALLAFLVLATALPVFLIGLNEFGENWITPSYSHGPVVVVLSLWVGLRALRDEPQAARTLAARPLWPGIALVLLGLAAGAIGTLGGVGDVSAYGVIVWLAGLLAVGLGFTRARRFWLPVLLLVLALPLPQFLYWQVTTELQHVSAVLGMSMIQAMGLSVFLDGNIIDLGVYRLQVAEACSGLQYLFPVVAFALFFAAVGRGPLWQRLALVALSAPLAVVMNALRVAVTAFLVNSRGIEAAEGFLHAFEGWVILLACFVVLIGIMLLFRLGDRGAARNRPLIDLDLTGLGALTSRAAAARPAPRFVLVAALGLVVSAMVFVLQAPPQQTPSRVAFVHFPSQFDSWRGLRGRLDPAVEAVVGADDYLDMTFVSAQADAPVHMFAAFYADQTDGSALHSPQICLPANGWEVLQIGKAQLDMTGTGFGVFEANRAEIIKGTERQLVYYWFEQRGTRMTNDFAAKLDMLADGVRYGRRDGAIVRFVTPIKGDDIDGAEARIRTLIRSSISRLPLFIPT